MRTFLTLLNREIRAYFHSPIAFVVLVFFLLLTGFNFYATISVMNQAPAEYTVAEAYFNTVLFWFPFVLVFPIITMRLFADEWRMGTIESLMTSPVRDWQVVGAKFLSAFFFYVILWLPTVLYFQIFHWIAGVEAVRAAGALWGAYAMLGLLGLFYISIGCLASALTRNQVIAAIVAFCGITLSFFAGLLPILLGASIPPVLLDVIVHLSAIEHMLSFSRGIFDTRPVILYLSLTIFLLFLTLQVFQTRRWKA